ncbi:E3 ubiquitin-protein ligase Topors-like [Grus japonensis]|uniref:E3 ubiquitin-protein ligase Topors n=1 Tax=Grus japonensis TaxID=30415 RepID=A0ABC9Y5D7_GRUJA
MATELDNRCPICLDSWEEASYVMPCCHRFCFTCIWQWADSKPECPLCKRRVSSIVHSVQAYNSFEEYVIRSSTASPVAVHQAARSPSWAAGEVTRAPVGSLQADTWGTLFWDHPALLEPLLPWLHQALRLIFEDDHLQAAVVEDIIMSSLVLFGLDEDVLVQLLGLFLHNRTATFVHDVIGAVVRLCGGEARHPLGLEDAHAAGRREGSCRAALSPTASQGGSPTPSPAPSSSPARYNVDELLSTSTAALGGNPDNTLSAPVPILGEQEEPQEEPEEAVAGPSTSSHGRERSPGEPQRPPKRRASSPEASSQPNKRPPHRQH